MAAILNGTSISATIGASEFATDALTAAKIAAGAIAASEIADDAIDGATFADDVGVARTALSDYDFAADTGSQAAYTVFTVTGNVLIHAFLGVCETACEGATATIEVGVSGNTAALIAQSTATELIANELWHDASPTTTLEQLDLTGRSFAVSNGQDVIMTIGTADLTAGKINFYCLWLPLSASASVVAA